LDISVFDHESLLKNKILGAIPFKLLSLVDLPFNEVTILTLPLEGEGAIGTITLGLSLHKEKPKIDKEGFALHLPHLPKPSLPDVDIDLPKVKAPKFGGKTKKEKGDVDAGPEDKLKGDSLSLPLDIALDLGGKPISCKVVFLAEAAAGSKTSLLNRYCKDEFMYNTNSTIGAGFYTKTHVDVKTVVTIKWDFCDTAGQERYSSLNPMYMKGCEFVVIGCDVASDSFYRLDEFAILSDSLNVKKVLVLNKCDLPKWKWKDEWKDKQWIDQYCAKQGYLKWFYTSAKDNIGIKELFDYLGEQVVKGRSCGLEEKTRDEIKLGEVKKKRYLSNVF